jgi:hypothetical protein
VAELPVRRPAGADLVRSFAVEFDLQRSITGQAEFQRLDVVGALRSAAVFRSAFQSVLEQADQFQENGIRADLLADPACVLEPHPRRRPLVHHRQHIEITAADQVPLR